MNLDLTGKNAVVCGASSGLGLASAVELSRLGANVTLFARDREKLGKALGELDAQKGQKHGILVADFRHPEKVKEVIQGFISGGTTVNILVNNTGGPAGGPLVKAAESEFISAFQAHIICNQYLVQAVLPGMEKSGYGRIVNIISISVKEPIAGLGVSNTIRGAVASWSKTLANELGPKGITVNNVLPGYTRTARYDSLMQKKMDEGNKTAEEVDHAMKEQIPLRRIGDPQDFGAVVAFLCSPVAGYVTGVNLPVDGGRTGCL